MLACSCGAGSPFHPCAVALTAQLAAGAVSARVLRAFSFCRDRSAPLSLDQSRASQPLAFSEPATVPARQDQPIAPKTDGSSHCLTNSTAAQTG